MSAKKKNCSWQELKKNKNKSIRSLDPAYILPYDNLVIKPFQFITITRHLSQPDRGSRFETGINTDDLSTNNKNERKPRELLPPNEICLG